VTSTRPSGASRGIIALARDLLIDSGEAAQHWDRWQMSVGAPVAHAEGSLGGYLRQASSPQSTQRMLWWFVDTRTPRRVVELRTESHRADGDWRAARRLLSTALVP
jgi:hypothetical protein